MRYMISLLLLILPFLYLQGQSTVIDSLFLAIENAQNDTTKIDVLNALAIEFIYNTPAKTVELCKQSQALALKIGDQQRELISLNRMGGGYWSKGDLGEALQCFEHSMQLARRRRNAFWEAKNIGNIGLIYSGIGNKSLAKNYYLKAYHLLLGMDKFSQISSLLVNIGTMCLQLKEYDSAKYYYHKVYEIEQKYASNDTHILYLNLGDLALRQKAFTQADSLIRKSLHIASQKDDLQIIAYDYFFLADIHFHRGELDSALVKGQKAIKLALQSESREILMKAYKVFSKILNAYGKGDQAYKYYRTATAYQDSLQSVMNKKALQVFEYNHKQGELALLKTQKEAQKAHYEKQSIRQYWIIATVSVILISLSVLTCIILLGRNKLKKTNYELSAANQKIQAQAQNVEHANQKLASINQELDIRNKNIMASIQCALRIQQAILPSRSELQNVFENNFVLFRPRDIVSGDFYWLFQNENLKIIVLADCTGHGVSGALMTMIGSNILNQIVHHLKIYDPDQILNTIPGFLQKTLLHAETQITDGMDISILAFENNKVHYAGAMQYLYYYENQELKRIKGDRVPIEARRLASRFCYQKHTLNLISPITFYLASDGFQDQFGGQHQRKYMTKNFRKLLSSLGNVSFERQHEVLGDELRRWMSESNQKQTDDITVIGLHLGTPQVRK